MYRTKRKKEGGQKERREHPALPLSPAQEDPGGHEVQGGGWKEKGGPSTLKGGAVMKNPGDKDRRESDWWGGEFRVLDPSPGLEQLWGLLGKAQC